MQIQTDTPLSQYTTMRLGGNAAALTKVTSKEELVEALGWATSHHLPSLVLGGGSNVIFTDGFAGLVILNRIPGFEVLESDAVYSTIRIGAGEDWDEVVDRTTEMELTGIEALSAIPGTAGATPVQNVGAYGQEIADTFVELEAYDLQTHAFVTLDKAACGFTYRGSIFKSVKDRRYIIVSITLRLQKANPQPPFYASLERYLQEHNLSDYTPRLIREAVIAIRAHRLPDPAVVANTGSFFKNPIVAPEVCKPLQIAHPDMPHWPTKDGRVKLSAGWLIEHAGLTTYKSHGMELYEHNALVFVNKSAKSYDDLAAFREAVIAKVHATFGVTLEQEPELL
ncbi:MAG TPA: UDP-N-acetylmuramate dehydrogenase [Candidatus Saccharimonadales bacterium]|nr:UDP-N-acetylmuramate dehydrogenase [Candidatus Saccharimonadales bacterium]